MRAKGKNGRARDSARLGAVRGESVGTRRTLCLRMRRDESRDETTLSELGAIRQGPLARLSGKLC